LVNSEKFVCLDDRTFRQYADFQVFIFQFN
jgi:hypothetical protein